MSDKRPFLCTMKSDFWDRSCEDPYYGSHNTQLRHRNILQHAATFCNTLQHNATQYNTMQHNAAQCNIQQHTAEHVQALTAMQQTAIPK